MKNYNKMADDVLRRIGEYETEKKRTRSMLVRTAGGLCCATLVVLLGATAYSQGLVSTPDETLADALYPGIQDYYDERNGEVPPGTAETDPVQIPIQTAQPQTHDRIVIHQDTPVSSERENICLHVEDFVPMDLEELTEYYGTNIVPAVPEDLQEWEDQNYGNYGVFKRNGGTGEVYWDSTVLNYTNEDYSRSVNLEVRKDVLPVSCYAFLNSDYERSVVNGIELVIGLSANGYYHAQWMYQGVGFQLIAEGITQEELIAVLSSLVGA